MATIKNLSLKRNKTLTLFNALLPFVIIFFYYFVESAVFTTGYLFYGWSEVLFLSTFVSVIPEVASWFLFGIELIGGQGTAHLTITALILAGVLFIFLGLTGFSEKPSSSTQTLLVVGGILTFPLGIIAIISSIRSRDPETSMSLKERAKAEFNKNKLPYILIIPFVITLLFTYIIPIIRGFYITLFAYPTEDLLFHGVEYSVDPLLWTIHAILGGLQHQEPVFVGVNNYLELFSETTNASSFQKALGNNIYYVIIFVPGVVIVSLLLSVLLNSKFLKGENTYTTIFYMPVVTSILVVAVIWGRVIFELNSGLLNVLFGLIGPILDLVYFILNILTLGLVPALKAAPKVDWLTSNLMESIAIMSIWRRVGFNILILLAGLKSIPKSLYEAADIDGHGSFSQFKNITLPMLKGPLGVVMILELINGWQIFQELYGLNQAGADTTLAVYLIGHYARADVMTFASAVGYFIFAMTAFLGLLDRVDARATLKLIPLFTLFAVLFNIPSNRLDTLPASLGLSLGWTYDQLFLLLALIAIIYYILIVILNMRFHLFSNLLAIASYIYFPIDWIVDRVTRGPAAPMKLRSFQKPKLIPTIIYSELRRDLSGLRTIGFFMLFTTIFYYLNGYKTITQNGFGSTVFIGAITSMHLFYLFFIISIFMILAHKYIPLLHRLFSSGKNQNEVSN